MISEQGIEEAREAIGRALSERLPVEHDAPDRLKTLMHQLRLQDQQRAREAWRDDRQR